MDQSSSWQCNRFSVTKFPAFYGNRLIITAFTTALHFSVFWARSIQSVPTIPLPEDPSQYYNPIYAWIFQVFSLPQFSPPQPCILIPLPVHATCVVYLILFDLITRIILGVHYRSLSSSLFSFLLTPVTSYLLGSNILLSTLFSNTLSLRSPHNSSAQFSMIFKEINTQKLCTKFPVLYRVDALATLLMVMTGRVLRWQTL